MTVILEYDFSGQCRIQQVQEEIKKVKEKGEEWSNKNKCIIHLTLFFLSFLIYLYTSMTLWPNYDKNVITTGIA